MKRTILTLALVAATSGIAAFAQDASPSASPSASCPPAPSHEKGWRKHHEGPGGPGGFMRGGFGALTPAEREQLKAAHKKAKDDPAVAEARKNLDTARKAFADADRAALLKADPSIGPVLDKIAEAMKNRPNREGGPEGAPEPPK